MSVKCPFCGSEIPVDSEDCIQVDIPKETFKLFCDIKCLGGWINDKFRDRTSEEVKPGD